MNSTETTKELLSVHRLVRELNSQGRVNGFYANYNDNETTRCNRARNFANRGLEVHSFSKGWFKPAELRFSDAYGQLI